MSDAPTFVPRSPLAGVTATTAAATVTAGPAGIVARVPDGFALATVMARRGASEALAQRVRERFGIELPQGPRRSASHGVAFAGTGPCTWLALADGSTDRSGTHDGNDFAASLGVELAGVASVADQSDGYTLIRLSGGSVREALAKLIPIDVHGREFEVGNVASTIASHIGVTLWRLPDDGASAVFEVLMFRSLAQSFWHALTEASAEFGFDGSAS